MTASITPLPLRVVTNNAGTSTRLDATLSLIGMVSERLHAKSLDFRDAEMEALSATLVEASYLLHRGSLSDRLAELSLTSVGDSNDRRRREIRNLLAQVRDIDEAYESYLIASAETRARRDW